MVKKRLAILGLVFALTGTTVFGHCYNPSVVYAEEGTETDIDVKSISGFKNYWSFAKVDGNSVTSDAGEEAVGELKGTATIGDSGSPVFGDALCLTGASGNAMDLSNYIDTGANNTSFSMWYKCTELSISASLLQHGHTSSDNGRSILSIEPERYYKTYLNGKTSLSTAQFEIGKWEHITVVFDQTEGNRKVYFYVNGVQRGEIDNNPPTGTTIFSGDLNLRLGEHKYNTNPMKGYIDEFYVFEKALSSEEAAAVYNETISKAKALLDEKIAEAKELYNNMDAEVDTEAAKGGVLDETQENAFEAIESAIASGEGVAENASVEEFENAINAIDTAITELRNIYQDGVALEGCSLILDGTIDLNFYMDLEDVDALKTAGAYMNFTLDGVNYSKVYLSEELLDGETNCYKFKYGVPVKDMGKAVQAQLIVPVGDAAERKGLVYTYSVKEYINDTISKNDGNADLRSLVQAMSDFGEYATAYFDKDYELGTVYGNIGEITATDLSYYAPNNLPERDTYVGSSLLLKSDTLLRHYFKESVIVEGNYECKEKDETGYYYIEHTGIAAHQLGTGIPITVTINGVEQTITYSPLNYAYVALEKNSDTALMNLMRAMYLYYRAACNYMSP